MRHATLISTEILEASLDRDWVIVDCRYDLQVESWGRDAYRTAHIPGAQYVSLSGDLAGPKTGANGRHPVPSIEALADLFSRLGVDRQTQVAVYDQDSGMYASRCWWSLRYLGHDGVALVDGGWAKWVREGRPTERSVYHQPRTTFRPAERPDMLADAADVASHVADPELLLVDARAPERFEGVSEPIDRAAGHIPSARNHHFRSNLAADGTLLPPDALRAQFDRLLGGHDPSRVVMYCGSGVTACHNLLAMEHVGLRGARLYPGSWSEWSSDPARPVETGPSAE